MEITSGWCSNWFVSEDSLKGAIKQLEEQGVDLTTVFIVPSISKPSYYLFTWKNPPKKENHEL